MKVLSGSRFQAIAKRLALAGLLIATSGNAWAVGDSGGCSAPWEFIRILAFGTVPELETYIEKSRQTRSQMLNGSVFCSHGEMPLDHAVANGNLEVVGWLLDSGVDPNAVSPRLSGSTLFSRCRSGIRGERLDSLPKEEVRRRMIKAYRLVIARGADINLSHKKGGLDDPLISCSDPEMYPILKELGANVLNSNGNPHDKNTRLAALRYWANSAMRTGSDRSWSIVQTLASDGNNDLRGTSFEATESSLTEGLHQKYRRKIDEYEYWRKPKEEEHYYQQQVQRLNRLAGTVRLSPGILPDVPAKPSDVPDQFSPSREACFFPEIAAFPKFEFVAVMRKETKRFDPKPPAADSGPDSTEVTVGQTKHPVLLVLFNDRATPAKWVIRRTKDANILAVIVLEKYDGKGSKDVVSFDPKRPVYLGKGCSVSVITNWDGKRRDELRPGWGPRPYALDPFVRRGEPSILIMENSSAVIGAVPSNGAKLISWPESVRGKFGIH